MIAEKLLLASVTASTGGIWFGLTDSVLMAIVAQLGALALAGLAAFVSWRTSIISKRTHDLVNSRMDEFKAMFAQAKINEGVLQEKKDEVVRKAEIVIAIGQGETASHQPPQPIAASNLTQAIKAVPETTATRVVEKLAEK